MKVLVTGATGQLGRALLESIPESIQARGVDRAQCDLADPDQCHALVVAERPDLIINAGAYTQVDKAETERDLAFRINAQAPAALADGLARTGGRLIQVSTDFVFDGRLGVPYAPNATSNPLNVYGASKRAGEQAVLQQLNERAVVLRTAWVYSRHGSNFVKTMLRLMSSRDAVSVVSDQIGAPTWATSLASAVWSVAFRPSVSGVLHWTDAGVASWYDFAMAIQEEALARGMLGKAVPVLPIAAEEYARRYPASVPRPAFSVLDVRATYGLLDVAPLHWRIQLRAMLDELKS
ncbi:MAG: dTDP-4-dehydrorhamnose reductase [Steroidobacteraceae bacterium]